MGYSPLESTKFSSLADFAREVEMDDAMYTYVRALRQGIDPKTLVNNGCCLKATDSLLAQKNSVFMVGEKGLVIKNTTLPMQLKESFDVIENNGTVQKDQTIQNLKDNLELDGVDLTSSTAFFFSDLILEIEDKEGYSSALPPVAPPSMAMPPVALPPVASPVALPPVASPVALPPLPLPSFAPPPAPDDVASGGYVVAHDDLVAAPAEKRITTVKSGVESIKNLTEALVSGEDKSEDIKACIHDTVMGLQTQKERSGFFTKASLFLHPDKLTHTAQADLQNYLDLETHAIKKFTGELETTLQNWGNLFKAGSDKKEKIDTIISDLKESTKADSIGDIHTNINNWMITHSKTLKEISNSIENQKGKEWMDLRRNAFTEHYHALLDSIQPDSPLKAAFSWLVK